MVGRQTLRMDSGTCSGTVADESPASSPSSSPSPDGGRRELQRARALQGSCSGGGGGGGLGGLGGRGRPAAANAARERSRVQTLRTAFLELQRTLPSVPPDTKLSKLDVLILATTYIAHLTRTLYYWIFREMLLFCDVIVCSWCIGVNEAQDILVEHIQCHISSGQTVHIFQVTRKHCVRWNNESRGAWRKEANLKKIVHKRDYVTQQNLNSMMEDLFEK